MEITTTARWRPGCTLTSPTKCKPSKGRVFEWDVINHPVGWTGQTYENDPDVNEGTDIFKQIIDHARSVAVANPDIPDDLPLWINEDDIIRGSGGRANNYERIIQYLVDNGSAPDGIGFQGHFIEAWNGITTNYRASTTRSIALPSLVCRCV